MTSPNFQSALNQYNNDRGTYLADIRQLMADFQKITSELSSSGNSLQAIIAFITSCLPQMIQISEDSLQLQADAANVATDLREQITNVQQTYNNLIADIQNKNTAQGQIDAAALAKQIILLSKMLHQKGITAAFGSNAEAQIGEMSGFLQGIENFMGTRMPHTYHIPEKASKVINSRHWSIDYFFTALPGWTHAINFSESIKVWGISTLQSFEEGMERYHPNVKFATAHFAQTTVSHYHQTVVTGYPHMFSNLNSLYNEYINTQAGTNPLQSINSDLNSLNQTVSGISSAIQSQITYLNQTLQQYYGFYNTLYQDISQISGQAMQNFKL